MHNSVCLKTFTFAPVFIALFLPIRSVIAQMPTVKLSAPSAVFLKATPVVLDVDVVNTTPHEIKLWAAPGGKSAEIFDDITGRDANGKELVRTTYGKSVHDGPAMMISRIQRTIRPDQSYRETMDVSKVFDLSHAGLYRFQIKREYLLNERVDIDSNIVTVEIK